MKSVKRFGVWLLGMLLLSGCSSQPVQESEPMSRDCFAMNTYISFTIYTDVPESVLDTVEAEIKGLGNLPKVRITQSFPHIRQHVTTTDKKVKSQEAEAHNIQLKALTTGSILLTAFLKIFSTFLCLTTEYVLVSKVIPPMLTLWTNHIRILSKSKIQQML